MYAAHFAAGLAIKSCVPKTPAWALLTAVFVPDLIWIVLANRGIEPTEPSAFFDDWSHSLATTAVWAALFALIFWRRGRPVVLAVWIAGLSHFLLDFPIHPKFLALYPYSGVRVGIASAAEAGATTYWWVQLGVLTVLSLVYAEGARRARFPMNLIAASCVFLFGLHLLMFPR